MAGSKKRKKSGKKHCSGKREVFQMVQNQINEKHPPQRTNVMGQQLKTINALRPVLEATRKRMREKGRIVLVPDAEKFFPEA